MKSYYIYLYRKILERDEGILNRTRLRILFACIFTFLALTSILTLLYALGPHNFLLYRIIFFCFLYAIAFYLFSSRVNWHLIAHYFLCCLILMIWSNVLMIRQSLYIVNLQYCFLTISASYYLLGAKNGFWYSFAAMLPVAIGIITNDFLNRTLPSQLIQLNLTGYAITIIFSFFLILYIHYLFFRALTKFKKREHLYKRNQEKALEETKAQTAAKINFLNTMSHEIRTPLNAIVGMSNLLMNGGKLPEQLENIEVLHFSAQNLMSTVNAMIDFNNLEHDQVDLQKKPFQLFKTVTNVCNTFRNQAEIKRLKFSCLVDKKLKSMLVVGDQLRLSQILFHLIGNAIKFTGSGFVRVTITESIVELQNRFVYVNFTIEDSGIGISSEKIKEIFDPFQKKVPRNQRQYQVSLGLTISYHLLKLHASELNVKSTEGKGTCFQFIIGYEIAEHQDIILSKIPDDQNTDLSALRILTVDDEKLNLMVVRKILTSWGISADEACNGQVALEMCNTTDYDIVLMDINMPVMDGFEASRCIKSKQPEKPVPRIIALTASIGIAIEEINEFPFIDDCLLKPFDPEALRAKLQQARSILN